MKQIFFRAIDRQWWVALTISIGVFMSTLDASIVNISLPTITEALNTNLTAVAWVVMGYLIIITGCLLLMGRLSDLFGQRRVYLFGFLTFTVGSALCGFSPTIYFLIGSRMIQGLGASALMGMACYAICSQGRWDTSGITGEKVVLLAGAIGIGIMVYGAACFLMRSDEIHAALDLARKKFGRENA